MQDSRCGMCAYIKKTSSIKFDEDNEFIITADMNRASNNLIYCISCNGCISKYIYQTVDTVRSRVNKQQIHKQQIANKEFRMLGMSQHIKVE